MKNYLKEIRTRRNMTLEGLAELCGKGKGAIWELEQQKTEPRLKTAYAIAKVLGVEVHEIWPNEVRIVEETLVVRRVAV